MTTTETAPDLFDLPPFSAGTLPDAPLSMPRQIIEGPGVLALISKMLRASVLMRRSLGR